MRRREVGLAVYVVLTATLVWSSTTLLLGSQNPLLKLRGADECNCVTCDDANNHVFYECDHTTSDPNPGGPPPDPNNPDPNQTACSPDNCIKNTLYGAKCPDMDGGVDCPMKDDASQPWCRQELFNDAPAGCLTPDYNSTPIDVNCSGWFTTAWCVVDTCGGDKIDFDPADPNDPNEYRYDSPRKVCDVNSS
jgi:hypothetical protein